MIAGEAVDRDPLPEWKPCPVCGSTPRGISVEEKSDV